MLTCCAAPPGLNADDTSTRDAITRAGHLLDAEGVGGCLPAARNLIILLAGDFLK